MKLKIFIVVCVSAFVISFPENIIGCGPDADPYDYYTSFFSRNISSAPSYKPFFYTGYNFLYDESEPINPSDLLADEWAAWCGKPVTAKDAKAFVTEFSIKDVTSIYNSIAKQQPLKIPDSVKDNSMTRFFFAGKDLEALGYILYAQQVQPYVTGDANNWEPIKRDSVKMVKLIKNGQQLLAAAKDDFFKIRYAYQVIRLAEYSGQYPQAIEYYDKYIPGNKTETVLQSLSLSLKAGALYNSGQKKQAAYLFSRAFTENGIKRVSNYTSFFWSVDSKADRGDYLSLCKNNAEKAAMLALFSLGSTGDETGTMKMIYDIDPHCEALEVITAREINKLEETFLTPMLDKSSGGKKLYYSWTETATDSALKAGSLHAQKLATLLDGIGKKGNTLNSGLFEVAAGYTAFMAQDLIKAKGYLKEAQKMTLSKKVQDQMMLTSLLIAINEKDKIDATFEQEILPSLKWLQKKALSEKSDPQDNVGYFEWKVFYRNVMNDIFAKRFHAEKNFANEVLAIGNAENIFNTDGPGGEQNSLEYLRGSLVSDDVARLYSLMTSKSKTDFENFLIANNTLKVADVVDFAGTAYLRDYKYEDALKWFDKSALMKQKLIDKDPFIELLYDQEEKLSSEKKGTSKTAFCREMLRLQELVKAGKTNTSLALYKMALGLYNTTYYGHAWELVQYYRSGSDGYYIPADATSFQKQYFGCYRAEEFFKKAMDASADKNFRGKCYFMMAKCRQKQLRQPQYSDFPGQAYDQYDRAIKAYSETFRMNSYFLRFVSEFASTPFYREALTSCSYLKDFVRKK